MENRYNQAQILAFFKEFLAAENLKKVSIKNYVSDLRHFFSWLPLVSQAEFFSMNSSEKKFTLTLYLNNFKKDNKSLKTKNRRLSTFRKFLNFAYLSDFISENEKNNLLKIVRPFENKANQNNVEIKQFLAIQNVQVYSDIKELLSY